MSSYNFVVCYLDFVGLSFYVLAERAMQTFKTGMKKQLTSTVTVYNIFCCIIIIHDQTDTTHSNRCIAPAEIMFS